LSALKKGIKKGKGKKETIRLPVVATSEDRYSIPKSLHN